MKKLILKNIAINVMIFALLSIILTFNICNSQQIEDDLKLDAAPKVISKYKEKFILNDALIFEWALFNKPLWSPNGKSLIWERIPGNERHSFLFLKKDIMSDTKEILIDEKKSPLNQTIESEKLKFQNGTSFIDPNYTVAPGINEIELKVIGYSWNPDQSSIIMAIPKKGLYLYNIHNPDKKSKYLLKSEKSIEQFPVFSPDGSKICFISDRSSDLNSNNGDLFLYNFSNNSVTRLTNTEEYDFGHCWSPDSRYIFFHTETMGVSRIYMIDTSIPGKNPQALTGRGLTSKYPVISPDGKKLAFFQKNSVHFFDLKNNRIIKDIEFPNALTYSSSLVWYDNLRVIYIGNFEHIVESDGQRLNISKPLLLGNIKDKSVKPIVFKKVTEQHEYLSIHRGSKRLCFAAITHTEEEGANQFHKNLLMVELEGVIGE